MTVPFFAPVQVTSLDEKVHRRQLAEKINSLNNAKFNCSLLVTLNPNSTTTTITDARITANSVLCFMPQTSHAAAALTFLYVLSSNQKSGSAILTHASSANTDQNFNIGIFG